jgi:hypothetical protein
MPDVLARGSDRAAGAAAPVTAAVAVSPPPADPSAACAGVAVSSGPGRVMSGRAFGTATNAIAARIAAARNQIHASRAWLR